DKQAIEMIMKNNYDVVLLDMIMPVMDGLETMRVMKSKFKMHPPVIALSANVLEADKKKYFSYGVADYISKPVKSEDLYEKLLKWKLHVNQKEKVTVVK
ncbi:MAG: response regulator, partial [Bacteroidota bacterium]